MRNHSGFLMANLTLVSLPVQDLYRMMVEHDGYDMSRTLRTHIDLGLCGIEKQIFKVILYSCCINLVTLHCIEHIDVRCRWQMIANGSLCSAETNCHVVQRIYHHYSCTTTGRKYPSVVLQPHLAANSISIHVLSASLSHSHYF